MIPKALSSFAGAMQSAADGVASGLTRKWYAGSGWASRFADPKKIKAFSYAQKRACQFAGNQKRKVRRARKNYGKKRRK